MATKSLQEVPAVVFLQMILKMQTRLENGALKPEKLLRGKMRSSMVQQTVAIKNNIHGMMLMKIIYKNGEISLQDSTENQGKEYSNLILSGSGTLFSPGILNPSVTREDLFLKYAPTNDDLWFWTSALNNGKKINHIEKGSKKLYYIEKSQEMTPCLWKNNLYGEKLLYKDLITLIKMYNLEELLAKDYKS